MPVRVGLALPSFVQDPDVPLSVAVAAEGAGLDGVFCYDHLFRNAADGSRRPALEAMTLLGAVAAATPTIHVGTLVARATLRPAAQLAAALDTAQRISGGRLIAAIGAGDSESRDEMVTFGYDFGTPHTRVDALEEAVEAARGRGYPVWVGGQIVAVRDITARLADGWNAWGLDVGTFGAHLASINDRAGHHVTGTWGGLVLLGADDAEVSAKRDRLVPGDHVIVGTPGAVASQLRPFVDAGAEWILAAPLDSTSVGNAALLAEVRARL